MDRLIDDWLIENYYLYDVLRDLATELPHAYSKNLQEDILEPKTQKTANNTTYIFFSKNNIYVIADNMSHLAWPISQESLQCDNGSWSSVDGTTPNLGRTYRPIISAAGVQIKFRYVASFRNKDGTKATAVENQD